MNELNRIKKILKNADLEFKMESLGEYDLIRLISSKDDSPFIINVFPVDNNDLRTRAIQFYFEFKPSSKFSKHELNELLFNKIKELPYGHLNFYEDKIYYKYVLVCIENNIEEEVIFDILNVMNYSLDVVIQELIN
ncbi:MAG: hypothetical protein CBE49_002795 [Rickettsiales bacterium TMED289]|nr:MAG: hypothetical protein CBE49_002795 [Rickettsiales bacterium TMED289]|tara:strand:+ start:3093 stop:3500 length:408 start_codon:yes stop_codon:yes gene_type:complete